MLIARVRVAFCFLPLVRPLFDIRKQEVVAPARLISRFLGRIEHDQSGVELMRVAHSGWSNAASLQQSGAKRCRASCRDWVILSPQILSSHDDKKQGRLH